MKLRIKEIRNSTGLSQRKFADELGVSLSNIESYEMGRRTPSEAFIQLICTRYHINENWLRTGEGEMLIPATRESQIADITAKLIKEDNPKRLELQKLFSDLSIENIELLYELAKTWVKEVEKNNRP